MANEKKRIEEIYHLALEKKNKKERSAYLDSACGDDTKLRASVEGLLQAHDKAGNFLEVPSFDPDVTLDTSLLTEGPGTTIDNYKLLEQIGEGGMAAVYMAEQGKPLHRRVALKIIKLGMDTKQVIARFEAERQTLAVMDHPNIAKVFDAGTTETGRPYFVMELVRGVSISEYCDKNKLDTKERLDLFVQVCNAVQHAHQKGIIHRDIKPSNVMVTLHDGKPVPKVIDFGIAKATSQRLTEKTLYTRYAQMIGTPAYMSPEQAEMSGLDIDTRTDIYSLGVLLYELLTGARPFSEKQFREAGYLEIQRIIREEEPLKPSTKLSTLGDTLIDVAEHRKSNPDSLAKLIRGDLDWIVMRSLEKDRTRRYATAIELVADITRHLNHEPVLAGPPSQIYRLRKFIRRHRTHAIGAAIVAVLLAGMTVISVMYIQVHNRGKEAEFLKHKDILSKAMEFRSMGQFQDALNKVETMLSSKHVGPEARLLRARLILELQGPADAVKELEKLINERDEIACQAHLLLARIYLESASGVPEKTEEYQQKAKEHQQKGEKLFSETAEAYFNQAMIVGTVKKTLECLNKAVELKPGHYPSRKARALAYYALRDYRSMERDAVAMTTLRDWDSLGYSLLGIALCETENFADAVKYHNRAIEISPDEAELYDQRRRTHMKMANFEQALLDARKCVELQSEKSIYHFHTFCALVASGRYDEAIVEYDTIIESGLMSKQNLDMSAAKYVSDTLDMGLLWHPPRLKPEGAAFLAMHEAAEIYLQLAKKAKRVVPEGFHATWSPDGSELAYSCGILGFTGIEILNLETGKTSLLTVPGLDPAWSPDGSYIAFTRHRQHLLLADLTTDRLAKHPTFEEREIWIAKADGTGEPELLVKGYWPHWSRDSKRVFYHSKIDNKIYSISIEDSSNPNPIIWYTERYPVVAPNEEYVACGRPGEGGELQIVELSTNSIVARWRVPLGIWEGLLNWSPDGKELSRGGYDDSGLWIYSMKEKKATKFLSGSFGWCSWSPPDGSKIAIGRVYGELHHEIWVANLDPNIPTAESFGPGRTVEEHCQEMVDYYTRRINFDPEIAGHYLSRAECYMYLDDREKAFADLEKYVGDPSRIANAYNDLAWILVAGPSVKLRDHTSVVELARKAVQAVPEENSSFWNTLGVAHYRAGQWAEAITALTKPTKLTGGKNRTNFLFLAMAHWQSGNKAAAANWYNKATEQIRKRNLDIASLLSSLLYSFYLEAAELMGIKVKEFYRKAPLTGKQIQPVTARADSSHLDMTVEHIVDGTGLADEDKDGLLEHGETPEDMWLSETSPTNSWIEFDLGGVYELGSILVWNYNERGQTKRGVKGADISVWTTETGWQKILDDFEFAEAEGSFDYDEPTLVKFDGVKAQRVRFDDLFSFGDEDYVGLSEVRFFQMRGPEAIRPHPANGVDISVSTEAKLSWTTGVGAKTHRVCFGTNPDSLRHLDQIEEPNCVDMPKLKQGQRYFWRVDVVKLDGSEVKGDLWTFTTGRMVGWWKFDETKGETVIDSSGNGLNGKLVGDARIISDPVRGNVLSLDGDGDYVDCGNEWALDITDEITVAAWINAATWTKEHFKGCLVSKEDWLNGVHGYVLRCGANGILSFQVGINIKWTDVKSDPNSMVTDKWYHVAGTYDGNRISIFINGRLSTSKLLSGKIDRSSFNLNIGRGTYATNWFFHGLIDDVRIYNYALTEAEVKELYAGRGPGPNEKLE